MDKKKFFIYLLPLILYALLIFFVSSLPGDEMEPITLHYTELINDKSLHSVEFFVFGFLFLRMFLGYGFRKNAYFLSIIFTILYSLTDEVHQLFVHGRFFSLIDILFDSAGGVFILVFKIKKLRKLLFLL